MQGARLQASDIRRLDAAQRILLSPVDYEDAAEWQLHANRAVRRLVGADHSVFSMPSSGHPSLLSDDTDPTLQERFLNYFAGIIAGEFRFHDPVMQNGERIRRAAGRGAFHELDLGSRDEISHSTAFQEVFRPAGLTNQIALSVSLPNGEATQFFGYEGSRRERRSERGLVLLRLLVPAFEAGVCMLHRLRMRGAAFAGTLDDMAQSVAVYSATGMLVYQTRKLREVLAAEPDREQLLQEMNALARRVGDEAGMRSSESTSPVRDPGAVVLGRSAEYRLFAGYLTPALLGAEGVLVTVERRRPPVPRIAELVSRFPLTEREAEVAVLLARGLPDVSIAERLMVSPHTARRHSERVLKKLGVHSRAAVAVTLLGSRDWLG